ncbi:MAG: 2-dehydropantoate 2-reductase [Bacteroidota bacterium]
MQKKYRIAILGMGGVGGFLGGKLAAAYSASADKEIIFIARGSNAQAIKENGLKLITPAEEITARPDVIAAATDDIGSIDLLICCTKTYDLEDSIKALAPSVTADTIVLPILNGVDSTEKVLSLLPGAKVLQGCIYLVSKLIAPGVVQQRGEFYSLHFGGDERVQAEMPGLLHLFTQANINAIAEEHISAKVWSKFSFISPIATYTSAHNISIGKILESDEHKASLKNLMTELVTLATSLSIALPADAVEKNFATMAKLPYETTSSMQADFAAKKSTELETLTGSVVRKAAAQGIKLDAYAGMYEVLKGEMPNPSLRESFGGQA